MGNKILKNFILFIVIILASPYAEAKVVLTPKGEINIPPNFIEIKHIENTELPETTYEDQKRGYIIFSRENLEGVYPNSIPASKEITNTLKVFGTPGEYVPISFSIYTLRNLSNLTTVVNSLIDDKGCVIPRKNITINSVLCWEQRIGASAGKTYGIIPELLIKEPLSIKKGVSSQFWITIKIPKNISPGIYRGNISLISNIAKSAKIKIELKVLPFNLLKPPDMFWGVFSEFSIDTQQLKDLSEHGIDTICGGYVWAHAPPRPIFFMQSKEKSDVLDIDSLRVGARNGFQAFKQAGMKGQYVIALGWVAINIARRLEIPHLDNEPMFPKNYTPQLKRIYKDFLKVLRDESEKANVDASFWSIDEPGTHPHLRKVALTEYSILKECNVKTFLTCDIEFTRTISPLIDVRCYTSEFLFRNKKTYNLLKGETKEAGAELWVYTNPHSFYEARYFTGLLRWKAKFKTLLIYAYNTPRGDPYNDFDSSERDHYLVYPPLDNGSPIPTLRWEGIRQGIYDARYIFTLMEYINFCKISEYRDLAEKARKSREKLDKIMENVNFSTKFPKSNFDYKNFSIYRREIAQEIIKLRNLIIEKGLSCDFVEITMK